MNALRIIARPKQQRNLQLLLTVFLLFSPNTAAAVDVIVDTDMLTITVDGQAWDFGGSANLLSTSVNSKGIAVFTIGGDLNLSATDTLTGVGSRPLSLLIGNDVNIASGAFIDFSAIHDAAGPGGGSAGGGGDGGLGGAGGDPAGGGLGGTGGFGSFGFGPIPLGAPPLVKGTVGTAGFYNNNGDPGSPGSTGSTGGQGFGGTSGGQATGDLVSTYAEQTPMRPAEGGQIGLWPPIPSPIPGLQLILPDFLKSKGKDGLDGIDGVSGDSGDAGLRGNGGVNNASAGSFSLTGGGGGSGGSGGSGGQGGQSGSGGAGGGGGQGDWVNQIGPPPMFPYWVGIGGEGGDGGAGGTGGIGGDGGDGGPGGVGGAGGGAVEINALGRISFDGAAMAKGGDGAAGGDDIYLSTISLGTAGESGQLTGIPGFSFSPLPKKLTDYFEITSGPILKPSFGTGGGDGGAGGTGAAGGGGGDGGAGGGGAGGTVKLVGSIVEGTGSVNASGGISGDGVAQAGSGRFLIGANNVPVGTAATSVLTGQDTGVQASTTRTGNLSLNPYVTFGPLVPNMSGLVGGAEAFGYTTLQADTTHVDGDTLLQNSPPASVVGAIRLDSGPDEFMHNFDGHDMILVFNARTDELTDVRFGMNIQDLDEFGNPVPNAESMELAPFYVLDLLEGGWQNDPRFGGLGDVLNGTLQGYQVYATLIPEDTPEQGLNFAIMAQNAGNTFVASIDKFVNGQTLFAEFNPNVPVLTSTWIGTAGLGGEGTWNTASHWATVDENGMPVADVVPNNSTAEAFNVVINSGIAEVEQDTVITIDSLSIGAGDQLSVLDTQRLILERFSVRPASGMIENDGLIMLDGTTGETALRLSGTGIKFAGTGMLTSTDSQLNKLSGIRTTDGFTQYSDHTIEMVGTLGDNTLMMTNQGTIRALPSAMGNSLVIDPSGTSSRPSASFVNEGMLVADGAGSKLVLVDGHFQNKNGATIGAYNGAEIELQNVMFSIDLGSTLEVTTGSKLTINGDLELPEGAVIQGDADTQMNFAGGTFKNRGQILNPGGVLTLHDMAIDNTDGVIEMHAGVGANNVSGSLYLEGGIVRGKVYGDNLTELALYDVTFEDSSATFSEVYLPVIGDVYLGGRIEGPYVQVESSLGVMYLDGDTTFAGDALLYFDQLASYGGSLVFESAGGSSELVGYVMETNSIESHGDLYVSVEEWYLYETFTNRGYATFDTAAVYGGTIDNEGGIIEAYDASFDSVEIRGGTLLNEQWVTSFDTSYTNVVLDGSGDYEFQGLTILDNVTNQGGYIYADEVELRTRFTNNGTYEAFGDIYLEHDLTIDGGGEIILYGGIYGNVNVTLTLEGQFIEMDTGTGGTLGGDELRIINNESYINGLGSDASSFYIDPVGHEGSPTPGFINRGSISNVTLTDGYYDNTEGTLTDVFLEDVRIVGGTLDSTGGGFEVYGYALLENVTVNGSIHVDGDLGLRGTISSDSSASFFFSSGNLYIDQDTTFASVEFDIDTNFSGSSIQGNPAARLTIDSDSTLTTPNLEIGPNTPTFIIEGQLDVEFVDGTSITTTVAAGSTYSELAYVLGTGGDPTGVDPDATIVLSEDLVFSGLPRLRNSGYIASISGNLDFSNIVVENEGIIDGEVSLFGSVLKNDGEPISIVQMDESRIIGGTINTFSLEVFGVENYIIDAYLLPEVLVDYSALTLIGTTPEAGSGLPAEQVTLDTALYALGSELTLIGNVQNYGYLDLSEATTLAVAANLEENADPTAFIGFVNDGEIHMQYGDAYFEGLVTNNFSMEFNGTLVTFGPGLFVNNDLITISEGVVLLDPQANFQADPFSSITTPNFDLQGGTLIADSAWIDTNLTQLNWASGGVRLTGAAGHTVGSGGIIDGYLGGAASSINASRRFAVDETLTIPDETSLEVAGGELRAATIDVDGGSFTFSSGRLSFDSINQGLTNVAGTLAPGQSPGTAIISGDYTQQAAAALEIEIAGTTQGTEYDFVEIAGIATLGGTLEVQLLDDFMPTAGDTFEILTATGGFGSTEFDTTNFDPLPAGLVWLLNYTDDAVTLQVLLPGDYNFDGTVDAADYVVWRKIDGTPAGYNTWRANFGETSGSGSGLGASAAVPEPTTLVMLILGMLAMCSRRPTSAP